MVVKTKLDDKQTVQPDYGGMKDESCHNRFSSSKKKIKARTDKHARESTKKRTQDPMKKFCGFIFRWMFLFSRFIGNASTFPLMLNKYERHFGP